MPSCLCTPHTLVPLHPSYHKGHKGCARGARAGGHKGVRMQGCEVQGMQGHKGARAGAYKGIRAEGHKGCKGTRWEGERGARALMPLHPSCPCALTPSTLVPFPPLHSAHPICPFAPLTPYAFAPECPHYEGMWGARVRGHCHILVLDNTG